MEIKACLRCACSADAAMQPCLVGPIPRDMTEHGYYPSPQTPLYEYNGAWEDDTVRRQVVGGPRRATTCLSALLSPHSSHRGESAIRSIGYVSDMIGACSLEASLAPLSTYIYIYIYVVRIRL